MEYHSGAGSNTSYIGVRIPRREDPALLTGAAQTVAGLQVPGTVELAFTRSEVAHARLARADPAPARGLPGRRPD